MCWCWDECEVAGRNLGGVAVSTSDLVALVVGSVLLLGGLAAIVGRELLTHPERRLVGPVRNVVEVVLPLFGAVVLVAAVWASAG